MYGDVRAVEPLINALGDENRNVRETAVCALVEIGEPAVSGWDASVDETLDIKCEIPHRRIFCNLGGRNL